MITAPMMNAANRMCVCTRTAMTTFLPITGTSRLPIGIRYLLLTREVYDPTQSQQHVQDHHDDYQDPDYRHEGPLQGAVVRPPIKPRQREQQDDKDRRHHDGPKGDQG